MKNKNKLQNIKSIDAKLIFSLLAVCFITSLVWLNIYVEKRKLVFIEDSLSSYMIYLKNMIFSSTFDSLKKGNMKVFNNILKEIGEFEYVNEFSLLDKNGEVRYSSDDSKTGKIDKNVINASAPFELTDMTDITYYYPVRTAEYCTRCHITWKLGGINTYYKVSLSRQALTDVSNFSSHSTYIAVFTGVIVLFFFYMLYNAIRKNISDELVKESEKKFRSLFENIMDVLYRTDIQGNLTLISPSGAALLGYENEEEMIRYGLGQSMFYDLKERTVFLKKLAAEKEVKNYEIRLRKKDNTPVQVEISTKVIYNKHGNPVSIEGVFRDITYRKEYEKQLNLMGIVFDTAVESIVITNSKGVINKVNNAFTEITGYKPQQVVGRTPALLRSERHPDSFYFGIQRKLFKYGRWHGEIWNKKATGEIYPEWLSVTAITDDKGAVTHYVMVSHDITELKRSEEQLKYQAYHDALTGLPNRELLKDRLEVALAYCVRHGSKLAVLFVDLDNFKHINDTAGHHVGDIFLKKISEMLKNSCREEDTVARIGGDEFIILLPDAGSSSQAESVAKRVFETFGSSVKIDDYKLTPSASIGIAIFPDDGSNSDELLRAADMAMYHSKQHGKGSYVFYHPTMDTSDVDRLELESNIRKGLDEGEFQMYYQPVVSLSDGQVKGFESLIRWVKKDGRVIMPGEFIEAAEQSSVIHRLGDFVLEATCSFMEQMKREGYGHLSFSVNVASRQFQDAEFVGKVINAVKSKEIQPHKLVLEITENTVIKNVDLAISTMKKLKGEGVRLSLDDFGTGYSSLAYLKQFPISILKIDRTFTKAIFESQNEQHITDSIVSLAKNFGILVIAEGVEQREQAEYLKNIGCNFIQGFYFSRPIPQDQVLGFLKNGPVLDIIVN